MKLLILCVVICGQLIASVCTLLGRSVGWSVGRSVVRDKEMEYFPQASQEKFSHESA